MDIGGHMHLLQIPRRTGFRAIFTAALIVFIAAAAAPLARADQSRLAAWAIGHNLSLAALLYAQGGQQQLVDATLGKAKAAAAAVGVEIKPFPPAGKTKGETTAAIIQYLIKGDGWSTAEALASKYGREQGILFEIAAKSNLSIILYQPGDDSGIADIIKARSESIQLPAELWMPFVTAIKDKQPTEEVKQAVFKMHDAVAAALVKEPAGPPSTVGELLQQGGKQMNSAEIKQRFAGATVNGTAMGTRDSKFQLRYMPDGSAAGEGSSPGGSTKITGTWSTNADDQYCQDLRTGFGSSIKGCFYYFAIGDRLFAAPTTEKSAPVYERELTK
jgi:hypothetical protein